VVRLGAGGDLGFLVSRIAIRAPGDDAARRSGEGRSSAFFHARPSRWQKARISTSSAYYARADPHWPDHHIAAKPCVVAEPHRRWIDNVAPSAMAWRAIGPAIAASAAASSHGC